MESGRDEREQRGQEAHRGEEQGLLAQSGVPGRAPDPQAQQEPGRGHEHDAERGECEDRPPSRPAQANVQREEMQDRLSEGGQPQVVAARGQAVAQLGEQAEQDPGQAG
jgi:hypothetical protein